MKIAVIGHGGHSKVVRDLILSDGSNQIIGYFDDRYRNLEWRESLYFGPIASVKKMLSFFQNPKIIIAIGNNRTRKNIVQKLNLPAESYATLIHPSAVVSSDAQIGKGTVVMPHSVINADSVIGQHAIINTGAVVEHDNRIGDFVHVSPNAALTGSVKLGEGAHVGTGATVIPAVQIGEWSVIGAGATVIHELPRYCTAVGVPAKVIERNVTGGV